MISDSDLAAWKTFLNAHAAVVRRIDRDLAEARLPPLSWYDVLWPLYRAPERRLRMGELADEVVLSRTGLTRLVDRIEAAGLLRREPVPGDRRGAYAVLTEPGANQLRKMWPVYERGLERYFVREIGDTASTLRDALARVEAAARES